MDPNEAALVGPLLSRASATCFGARTVRLTRPVPNWAFKRHFGAPCVNTGNTTNTNTNTNTITSPGLAALPFAARQRLFAATAAAGGPDCLANLAVLRHARCPWSADAATAAARAGNRPAVEWLLEQGAPLEVPALVAAAAESLDVGLLAWLLEHPRVLAVAKAEAAEQAEGAAAASLLTPAVFAAAAGAASAAGAAATAAAAAAAAGPGTGSTSTPRAVAAQRAAAGRGMLTFLMHQGCPADEAACVAAAAAGHEQTFKQVSAAAVATVPAAAAAAAAVAAAAPADGGGGAVAMTPRVFAAAARSGSVGMAVEALQELLGGAVNVAEVTAAAAAAAAATSTAEAADGATVAAAAGLAALRAAAAAAGVDAAAACAAAAEAGSLSLVRWLHTYLQAPLTAEVLLAAASGPADSSGQAATGASADAAAAAAAAETVTWLLQQGCQPTLAAWKAAAAGSRLAVLDALAHSPRAPLPALPGLPVFAVAAVGEAAAVAGAAGGGGVGGDSSFGLVARAWGADVETAVGQQGALPLELALASPAELQPVLTAACGSGSAAAAAWVLARLWAMGVRPDQSAFEAAARAADLSTLRLLHGRFLAAQRQRAAEARLTEEAAAAAAGAMEVDAGAEAEVAGVEDLAPWRSAAVLCAAAESAAQDAVEALRWLLATPTPPPAVETTAAAAAAAAAAAVAAAAPSPPDESVMAAAASTGDVRRLEVLWAAGGAACAEAFVVAAWSGNVAALEWLAAHGPRAQTAARRAAEQELQLQQPELQEQERLKLAMQPGQDAARPATQAAAAAAAAASLEDIQLLDAALEEHPRSPSHHQQRHHDAHAQQHQHELGLSAGALSFSLAPSPAASEPATPSPRSGATAGGSVTASGFSPASPEALERRLSRSHRDHHHHHHEQQQQQQEQVGLLAGAADLMDSQAWFWAGVKSDWSCLEALLRLGCPWAPDTLASIAGTGAIGSWDFEVLRWMHARGAAADERLLELVPDGPQRREVAGWLQQQQQQQTRAVAGAGAGAETGAEAGAATAAGRQGFAGAAAQAAGDGAAVAAASGGGGGAWVANAVARRLRNGLGLLLSRVGLAGCRLLQRGGQGGRRT
ncbi:hypothetical protein HYH02_013199 [Chlamydomonas schloesseri]|uniref:Ankyrin repeat domain-containing protein n=1 Tax=Chlamydomonas schloesseri TaxID=2026947 RepID=A0A835VZU7_9CHLO|nr:hypothetical protein HYH02_013199 [Chlamydomonas schloesseri]|eukprot:KAG2431983.1 hypothetical protein HYH02_013199 [Chlamydomonas schloesseri]